MNETKRTRENVSQSDMPRFPLGDAVVLAKALRDNFASKGTTPINLAQAIKRSPSSSGWRILTGATVAYGLTEGGYNASEISLTNLGGRVVNPTEEGEDAAAMLEAGLRPSVLKKFYEKYDGAKLPKEDIGKNVLSQFGVPQERTDEAWRIVIENAEFLGILSNVNGSQYIQLRTANNGAGKPDAAPSLENQNKPPSPPPPLHRTSDNSVTMDIVKGELGITISADLQKKAWSNTALNEKVVALFTAAEAVAEEVKKLSPNSE